MIMISHITSKGDDVNDISYSTKAGGINNLWYNIKQKLIMLMISHILPKAGGINVFWYHLKADGVNEISYILP